MAPKQPRQTFEAVPAYNPPADLNAVPPGGFAGEVMDKWRTLGTVTAIQKSLLPGRFDPDPDYNPASDVAGYEEWASDLLESRSKDETIARKARIDQLRGIHRRLDSAQWGLTSDLIAGIGDPLNLIPIPAVKGIGLVRGALTMGAATTILGAGSEYLRQRSDPMAQPDEAFANIALSGLLGGAIGAPVGAWGASTARRLRAARAYEGALSDVDSPNFSLKPRFPEGEIEYVRPPRNRDGSFPRFATRTVETTYEIRQAGGKNYVFRDGEGWMLAAERELPKAERTPVDAATIDELGLPKMGTKTVLNVDEVGLKHEHGKGGWEAEVGRYVDDGTPVDRIFRDGNDYVNFRTFEHLAERALPRLADETAEAWRLRVGRQAMKDFRASKVSGEYAQAWGLEWALERLNFSPVAKAIRVFQGDNRVADLMLRLGGDYGWAIKANQFGWSTPPSMLLKSLRHTARWVQFRSEFDAEWVKLVSGAESGGKVFQQRNLTAAGYAAQRALQRRSGNKVLTYADFEEMVARAVFDEGDFEVNGFRVNENARNAAKAHRRMMEEYDDLHRAAGNFRDQVQINKDIKWWTKERQVLQSRVMQWLFGATGQPKAYQAAIRVTTAGEGRPGAGLLMEFTPAERIYSGDTHEAAIAAMIDELGDEGIRLSEQLTPDNYGYVSRPPEPVLPGPEAQGAGQPADYDPVFAKLSTVGEALARVKEITKDQLYHDLIGAIFRDVHDMPFQVLEPGDVHPSSGRMGDAFGIYDPTGNRVAVRGVGWVDPFLPEEMLPTGAVPETVLHEAVHGATSRRIYQGFNDIEQGNKNTPHARAATRLTALRDAFHASLDSEHFNRHFANATAAERALLRNELRTITEKPTELITYGLTNPPITSFLKTLPATRPKAGIRTMFDELIRLIAEVIGWKKPTPQQVSMLEQLLDVTGETLRTRNPKWKGGRYDLPELMADRRGVTDFVTQQDMMAQREAALSPAQRTIYETRRSSLDMANAKLAELAEDLKTATDSPHVFRNAAGKPEPYYHRVWDKAKGATEREQLTRLITKWFERDHPDGARERAELAVDNILNTDTEVHGTGSMNAMNQRTLDVPNSWSISDPEFGELRISDFIDKRILAVNEHYVRRSGVNIEAARMFGDAKLTRTRAELRDYLLERYYEPETTDAGRRAAMAKIVELENHLDTTRKAVLGVLRTSDPWRIDNRVTRFAKDLTTLSVMGKAALTSIPEIFRGGMVNGYATHFNVIFERYLGDLEKLRGNKEFMELTGELGELTNVMHNARVVGMEDGEPVLGGTSFERWVHDRIPGFYRLTGLTSLTTWQKTITMLGAQHAVMADARRMGSALLAGKALDPVDVKRLAALGISSRDAIVLSRMPIEFAQGGKLILPAVDAWKGLGAEGRHAREALLTAIHAEARRAIVTPSIGDRSTIFNGVLTSKGKAVWQSDLMTIPMQFLSYGMGAHNKMLTSALQGRDRTMALGLFYMFLAGILANWAKTDEKAWHAKDMKQILYEGLESSGVGGFWFTDLSKQLERATNNAVGLRPLLGIDPARKTTAAENYLAFLGVAPSHFYDMSRAFWDTSVTGTQRAGMIRRAIPYNNVLAWDRFFDTLQADTPELAGVK